MLCVVYTNLMLFASYMSRFFAFSGSFFVAYVLFIVSLLENFALVLCRSLCRRLYSIREVVRGSFPVFSHKDVICQ